MLTPTTVYQVNLNGNTAGTDYGQTNVTGTINLGSSRLSLSTSLTSPSGVFVILSNDGTDAVTGTFASLPEGGLIQANGQTFKITYKGGDGNDVALLDTIFPYVVSINQYTPGGVTTSASSVSYTVTFSEGVTSVDVADFSLTKTGAVASTTSTITA